MKLRDFYRHYLSGDPYSEVRTWCEKSDCDLHVPKSWGSTSPVFAQLINDVKPQSIVEFGTWKGTSAIQLTRHAVKHQPGVAVLCVDTWLASNPALWKVKQFRESVLTQQIERSQYARFLCNVLLSGCEKQILPFRNTSSLALQLMRERRVRVNFIYIDAGHSECEVASDLAGAWEIVETGGVIIGDDFSARFQGVLQAVRRFAKLKGVRPTIEGQKWWIHKR
jgi:predicted O-methyltransferase YrrM